MTPQRTWPTIREGYQSLSCQTSACSYRLNWNVPTLVDMKGRFPGSLRVQRFVQIYIQVCESFKWTAADFQRGCLDANFTQQNVTSNNRLYLNHFIRLCPAAVLDMRKLVFVQLKCHWSTSCYSLHKILIHSHHEALWKGPEPQNWNESFSEQLGSSVLLQL